MDLTTEPLRLDWLGLKHLRLRLKDIGNFLELIITIHYLTSDLGLVTDGNNGQIGLILKDK